MLRATKGTDKFKNYFILQRQKNCLSFVAIIKNISVHFSLLYLFSEFHLSISTCESFPQFPRGKTRFNPGPNALIIRSKLS